MWGDIGDKSIFNYSLMLAVLGIAALVGAETFSLVLVMFALMLIDF